MSNKRERHTASLAKSIASFIAVSFLFISVVIWVSRDALFPQRPHHLDGNLVVPTIVKARIRDVVQNKNSVIAIQIVTIHFQKNIRTETFFSVDNIAIEEIYARFIRNKVIETPVFTGSKMNNDRILRLINGEFVCVPFNQSTAFIYAPQASTFVKTVCAIGVPPEKLGEFSGILTLYLNSDPTQDEIRELFLFSRDMSRIIADNNPQEHGNKDER